MTDVGLWEPWSEGRSIDIDQSTGNAIKAYVRAHPDTMPLLTGFGLSAKSLTNEDPKKSLAVAETFLERVGYIRTSSRRFRENGANRMIFTMSPTDNHKRLRSSISQKKP